MENIEKNLLWEYKIDLQIFAEGEEKTEEATPRRRSEARKKGQVPKSMDVPQISTFLAGIVIINFFMKIYYKWTHNFMKNSLSDINIYNLTYEKFVEVFMKSILLFFMVVTPVLFTVVIAGVFSNYFQIGFLFTAEPIIPKFEKINPLNGLKNMFSVKKLVEILKSLIKLTIIGFYCYMVLKSEYDNIMKMPFYGFAESFVMMLKITYDMILKIAVFLFIIAFADYFYQRWEFEKSLKMTKQEIKEEYKQTEGDPQIKGRMRQMQREILRKLMIQEVPKATVVITNPTHLAIALKYEREEGMSAPKVIAKGADHMAMRIREIAEENNIPIIENKPLARAMYKVVEPGDDIPEEFYSSVAEILKLIYSKRK